MLCHLSYTGCDVEGPLLVREPGPTIPGRTELGKVGKPGARHDRTPEPAGSGHGGLALGCPPAGGRSARQGAGAGGTQLRSRLFAIPRPYGLVRCAEDGQRATARLAGLRSRPAADGLRGARSSRLRVQREGPHLTLPWAVELAEVDSLPRSENESPRGDGEHERRPEEGRAEVGPGVALGMAERKIRNKVRKPGLHVGPHVRVSGLIYRQCSGGMGTEEEDSAVHEPHRREGRCDEGCDVENLLASSALNGDLDAPSPPAHRRVPFSSSRRRAGSCTP